MSFYLIGDEIPGIVPVARLKKDLEKYHDDLCILVPDYVVLSNILEAKKITNYVVIARVHKIPVLFSYHKAPEPEVLEKTKKALKKIGIRFFYNFDKITETLQTYITHHHQKVSAYFVSDSLSRNSLSFTGFVEKPENRGNPEKLENSDFIFRIKKTYNKTIFYGLLYFGTVKTGQKIYFENQELVVVNLHNKKQETKKTLSDRQLCCIKIESAEKIKKIKKRNFLLTSMDMLSCKTKKWTIAIELSRNGSIHISSGFTCHALTKYGPITARVEEILGDKKVLYPGDTAHITISTEKNIYVDFNASDLDRSIIFKDLNILAYGTFVNL